MNPQIFFKKFNLKLILVHSIGTWFFLHALPVLSFLYDVDLYKLLTKYSFVELVKQQESDIGYSMEQVIRYLFYTNATWFVGLLLGFSVSLYLNLRHKSFWLNAVLVLVIMFTLHKFNLMGWTYLRKIFLAPGRLFNNTSLYLLTNGLILLALGFFVFLFKNPVNFYVGGRQKQIGLPQDIKL